MDAMDPLQGGTRSAETQYARLAPRVKAVVRDVMVYAAGLALLVVLGSVMSPGPAFRAVAIFLFAALFLYEPLLVSLTGGTIGHRTLNLRVVRAKDGARVSFPRALLRFLVKSVTGLVGFISIELTRRHQGLHDLAAGTVVIPRDVLGVTDLSFAAERQPEAEGTLPSVPRRVAVVLAYVVALAVAAGLVSAAVYTPNCLDFNVCTSTDRTIEQLIGGVTIVALAAIIVAGGRGYLPGAQRREAREITEGLPASSVTAERGHEGDAASGPRAGEPTKEDDP